AVRRGIDQRIDDLELFDDRARPSVSDDDRQRVLVFRAHVNEMNVEAIYLGDELWECVQFRLERSPVVLAGPVAREILKWGERHALRVVRDGLLLRPPRCGNPPTHLGELLVRKVNAERTDGFAVGWRAPRPGLASDSPLEIRHAFAPIVFRGRATSHDRSPRDIGQWFYEHSGARGSRDHDAGRALSKSRDESIGWEA